MRLGAESSQCQIGRKARFPDPEEVAAAFVASKMEEWVPEYHT